MTQLKALTYHGVTTFYYKPEPRKAEKPPDQFWITSQPFLYNERFKGGAFSAGAAVRLSQREEAGAKPSSISYDVSTLESAKKRLAEVKTNMAELKEVLELRTVSARMPARTFQEACIQTQKEAGAYLRNSNAQRAQESFSYNALYTNRFYETTYNAAKRPKEQLDTAQAIELLVYKLELGKTKLREALQKVALLGQMIDEQIEFKMQMLRRKGEVLMRKSSGWKSTL